MNITLVIQWTYYNDANINLMCADYILNSRLELENYEKIYASTKKNLITEYYGNKNVF